MKELDDFTVERLKELSTRENLPEVAALARIALAAKTAEESHSRREVWDGGNTWVQCSKQAYDRHEAAGNRVRVLYEKVVLPNSPELPDGWIKCSDELPPEGYEEDGGSVSVLVWYKHKPDCGHPYGISNVLFVRKHWEKWYTHWQPLPAPPTTEKQDGEKT